MNLQDLHVSLVVFGGHFVNQGASLDGSCHCPQLTGIVDSFQTVTTGEDIH